jgi:hypothetical protein
MAVKANITIDQGSSFETTLDVTDDNGDPINLTGYTGAAQMRKHYTSSNSFAFTVANATANIVSGRYVYDCELTTGSTVSRVLEGIVTVTPQVTR